MSANIELEIQKLEVQLAALRQSERKWYNICFGAEDYGAEDCSCCMLANSILINSCKGCPIQEDTGHSGCLGTPYRNWFNVQIMIEHHNSGFQIFDYRSMRAAELELHYLQNLQSKLFGRLQELEMIQERNYE